jgi:hypothetical protein
MAPVAELGSLAVPSLTRSRVPLRKSAIGPEDSVVQDSGAQPAASLQSLIRAWRDGLIHPIARLALTNALKLNALDRESFPDEKVEIDALRNDIAARNSGRFCAGGQRMADVIEYLTREKSDLPFVIFFVVKETIAANTAACNAFDLGHFEQRIPAGFLTVMTKEVVA